MGRPPLRGALTAFSAGKSGGRPFLTGVENTRCIGYLHIADHWSKMAENMNTENPFNKIFQQFLSFWLIRPFV
jgi:hypothetical protein